MKTLIYETPAVKGLTLTALNNCHINHGYQRGFSIWNYHKCPSYFFQLHLNTYVMVYCHSKYFTLTVRRSSKVDPGAVRVNPFVAWAALTTISAGEVFIQRFPIDLLSQTYRLRRSCLSISTESNFLSDGVFLIHLKLAIASAMAASNEWKIWSNAAVLKWFRRIYCLYMCSVGISVL